MEKNAARGDVVVTGLGGTTPLGGDVATTWSALLAGESGVREIEAPWAEGLSVRIGGMLRKDPADDIDRVQCRRLDRFQQIALVAAREAWVAAGKPEVDPQRLAVVVGTSMGGIGTMLDQHDVLRERGERKVTPFVIPRMMSNGAAAVVSIELGARGGAHAPTSACASGAEAIAVAVGLIRTGRADVVVAGGAEAAMCRLVVVGFAQIGSLSTRSDVPERASRPFDRDRDGFVIAEGAGMLVLERAEFAAARGAHVHGRVAGVGITSDAYDITNPNAAGQVRAIETALRDGGLSAADIRHVNAHATGTPTGDVIEATAIRKAIGSEVAVTATKSSTGHMVGAAGAVEALITVLSLEHGMIPPNRNLETPDPLIDIDLVGADPRRESFGAALSTSLGFGGHNVALAFTRA